VCARTRAVARLTRPFAGLTQSRFIKNRELTSIDGEIALRVRRYHKTRLSWWAEIGQRVAQSWSHADHQPKQMADFARNMQFRAKGGQPLTTPRPLRMKA
jgi:hypothetical protein